MTQYMTSLPAPQAPDWSEIERANVWSYLLTEAPDVPRALAILTALHQETPA